MGVGFNVLTTDPPRHDQLREIVAPPFMPRALEAIEKRAAVLISAIFDSLGSRAEIHLVTDLATRIPMSVICDILDLPLADWDQIVKWGKIAISGTDPDYMPGSPADTVLAGCRHLHAYVLKHAAARRGCPLSDPLSLLAAARIAGQPLSDDQIGHSGVQLMIAGFETTRNVFSGGVLALLKHPAQMALLRENPKRLRLAVGEFVRWSDPVISLMRVATADTELGGKRVRTGDRVVRWLPSANRDETAFERPYAFDVTRHANPHVGFGAGPRFCVGGPLAKIEVRLAMEQLLARYDGIEVTGPAERVQSSFLGGLKHLPVKLIARAA